ncbi:MAG TPA: serine/threonine-protein kinase [Opitutaceae bacterium]
MANLLRDILLAQDGLDDDDIPPGTRLGDYEILEPVGRGGCGVVYRALQDPEHTRRVVALKVILPQLVASHERPHREALFLEEMKKLARIKHAGIAQLITRGVASYGTTQKRQVHYFAMEWIDGGSIVAASRGLEPKEKVRRLLAVCGALEAAHRESVLHLDLKPANILFSRERQQALVLDFGFAQMAWAPLPTVSTGGTLLYSSPEQLQYGIASFRSDVYTLGIILFEMLTDSVPYKLHPGAELSENDYKKLVLAPKRRKLREFRGQFDEELERIVDEAICCEPDKRTDSVGELSRQLKRWLDRVDGTNPSAATSSTTPVAPPGPKQARAAAGDTAHEPKPVSKFETTFGNVQQVAQAQHGDAISGDKTENNGFSAADIELILSSQKQQSTEQRRQLLEMMDRVLRCDRSANDQAD